jgi:pimeloyl-ACP methyl ester carboxylesterase
MTPTKELVMTGRPAQSFGEIAAQPTFRTIDGVSIRFVESEQRNADALLMNPWPESVFAYESIWSRLAETTHLVAIDLPGFGRSERRDGLMTPRAMGEFIVRAADAFDLEKPHVVGPDIGTSAALFAAASHPGRFLSLVVGGGEPVQGDSCEHDSNRYGSGAHRCGRSHAARGPGATGRSHADRASAA